MASTWREAHSEIARGDAPVMNIRVVHGGVETGAHPRLGRCDPSSRKVAAPPVPAHRQVRLGQVKLANLSGGRRIVRQHRLLWTGVALVDGAESILGETEGHRRQILERRVLPRRVGRRLLLGLESCEHLGWREHRMFSKDRALEATTVKVAAKRVSRARVFEHTAGSWRSGRGTHAVPGDEGADDMSGNDARANSLTLDAFGLGPRHTSTSASPRHACHHVPLLSRTLGLLCRGACCRGSCCRGTEA